MTLDQLLFSRRGATPAAKGPGTQGGKPNSGTPHAVKRQLSFVL